MSQSRDSKTKDTAKLMFSIPAAQDVDISQSYTANALPARILHDGPMDFSRQHWDPKETKNPAAAPESQTESQTAYFRGRKLFGKQIAVPATHKGLVLRATDKTHKDLTLRDVAMRELESRRGELDAEAYEEEVEELRAAAARGELEEHLGVMEKVGDLDGTIVWGHESLHGVEEGGLARLEEWHALAAAMHEY